MNYDGCFFVFAIIYASLVMSVSIFHPNSVSWLEFSHIHK